MKIQHLKMVPGQKTSLGTQFIFNVEQQNMPDENLTEKIWWDLRYTFGANIANFYIFNLEIMYILKCVSWLILLKCRLRYPSFMLSIMNLETLILTEKLKYFILNLYNKL